MPVGNKIHSKAFKGKLKAAILQLRGYVNTGPIAVRQKLSLFAQMTKYKMLYENSLPENSDNKENMDGNPQPPRGLDALLRERSEQILSLQRTVDELNAEIKRLYGEEKKVKTEPQAPAVDEEALSEYERLNSTLSSTLATERARWKETELAMKSTTADLKAEIEELRAAAATAARHAGPLEKPETPSPSKQNETISRLSREIARYRDNLMRIQGELAAADKTVRSLKEELRISRRAEADASSRASVRLPPDGAELGSLETALAEELKKIVSAFDSTAAHNKQLAEEVAQLHRKSSDLFNENVQLKNKLKLSAEGADRVEKEKQRNEQCRQEIIELDASAQRRLRELSDSEGELAQKILRYKDLLKKNELETAVLEKKLSEAKESLRLTLSDLTQLSSAHAALEQEHRRTRRALDSFCRTNDIDWNEKMESEMEMYRRILLCSLCDTNIKNCALSKCMHCFCEECLHSRFKSRLRTCPACDQEFAIADIKKIYL